MPGSKTVVVFTTGVDTSPLGTSSRVWEKLETAEARILVVSTLGDLRKFPKGRKLSRDDRENRAFVKEGIAQTDQWLHQLSRASGGRTYFPKDAKGFQRAYREIAQFVSGEYNLAFVPPTLDGKRHSIRIEVRQPWFHKYRVHHRQAYVAYSPVPQ